MAGPKKRVAREPWTPQELDLLKQHYYSMPWSGLISMLGRTKSSIYEKASSESLRRQQRVPPPYKDIPVDKLDDYKLLRRLGYTQAEARSSMGLRTRLKKTG